MAKSIRDVLEELRSYSLDERDKGARFEQLMKDFLLNDTQYQALFDEVWLWSDYPERGNRADTGIDLVARERATGELVAIQCKFYAPDTLISKPDIDSFLASSSRAEFKGRMFISTSDNWGRNAEEAIAGQKPEVARIGLADLDESSIDWGKFSFQTPDKLEKRPRKTPRPHQEEAISNTVRGFDTADRGKLIMACGTGKTFTSLKLVERMFPQGGTVLFLVPSISLLSQALKEWTIESEIPLRSYAVCSDVSVGKRKNDEDLPVTDLAFPATTNTERLVEKFTDAGPNQNGLTVIFSTYQSIDVVARAQSAGIPEFDLIICDEAHRTTGVTLSGDDESAFVKVHNQDFIKGKKRLYMTATPKVFSDASSKKAEEAGAVLADMGKPDMFGEEFHRLGFGEAVERGILTDYKVLVLAVDEAYVARRFQRQFADENNELKLEDAAKIVGCWNGLSKRSTEQEEFQIDPGSMKRAVAFARSIAESKKIASMFQSVVDEETAQLNEEGAEYLRCEVEHVDGSFNSLSRNEKLDWLRRDVPDNTARILSNARCLTEGVDVPALDAVMFLNPRDSQVDVVQAVGRVMRKLDGKKYGYVILPIGVPADMDPATALNDNKKYKVVWQVLQALRSHDERFDAMVNKIDLTKKAPQIGIIGIGGGSEGADKDDFGSVTLDFPNFDQWRDAILAKIVQKVGEKRYWEHWAKDIAEIATRQVSLIRELVSGSDKNLAEKFGRFVKGLQDNLNPSITEKDGVEMLAQHLITKPVFDALFEGYGFTELNPVSLVMQDMVDALRGQSFVGEADVLEKFYVSVRHRAAGVESAEARQTIIKQLYEEFFRNAFKADSERLGIVYTPIEVVDFILHSVEELLQREFFSSLADDEVHLLDPFTGTGTFIVRLLQSGILPEDSLIRTYENGLHANELVLLAYYVAALNIEETFHGLVGGDYRPFGGIVLTDSFQLYEKQDVDEIAGLEVFPVNNERAMAQRSAKIRVVVGNPPYSVGQGSANDNNANIKYPHLDDRISRTYAARSTSTNKNNLYDSYIRAIRLASDRIGSSGVVCFVTNNGFLDSNTAAGVRLALQEEFSSIYVYNLRGNSRMAGDAARREGGNIFDIRVGVSIVMLVRNSEKPVGARIYYSESTDFSTKSDKLLEIREARTFSGLGLREIFPNSDGDWINQRSEKFSEFFPIAEKGKSRQRIASVFSDYSAGVKTNRDAWMYNFDPSSLERAVKVTIDFYNSERDRLLGQVSKANINEQIRTDTKKISWTDGTKNDLLRDRPYVFDSSKIVSATYRPFVKQFLYFDRNLNERVYQIPKLFPKHGSGNIGFYYVGMGSTVPFSVLMIDNIPDHSVTGAGSGGQFFPRWTFPEADKGEAHANELDFGNLDEKLDNISDQALEVFSGLYGGSISKDDVFYYVYGILHHVGYRRRFAADLRRTLPKVPLVEEFAKVSRIGAELSKVHLNYEQVEPFPLDFEGEESGRVVKMRFSRNGRVDDKTKIFITDNFALSGIPSQAYEYRVGSKSPIEWAMERYQDRLEESSGLRNDSNALFPAGESVRGHALLIRRLVTVSLESIDLIDKLSEVDIDAHYPLSSLGEVFKATRSD